MRETLRRHGSEVPPIEPQRVAEYIGANENGRLNVENSTGLTALSPNEGVPSMAHSTHKKARSKTDDPSPNPPGSPLSLINNRWCKKIKGKRHYFGTYPRTTYREAVAEYERCRFDLAAGHAKPRNLSTTENAVADICDAFLVDRKGKIGNRTWSDYKTVIDKFVLPGLGKEKPADDLTPADFKRVRDRMEISTVVGETKKVGPKTVENYCTRARAIINFANELQMTERPISHGGYLANPEIKLKRKYVNETYSEGRDLSREEILDVLSIADTQMKAIILTAIGAGLLSVDIAYLRFNHIDLENGMVIYPRRKTEVARSFVLWPEARQAIREWLEVRPEPHEAELSDHIFLTSFGNLWHSDEHRGNPLGREFKKLLKAAGHDRKGISFSALRKSYRTAVSIYTTDEADEKIADYICGHSNRSMRARYRQRYSRKKLIRISGYVRRWLYGKRVAK